MRTAISPLFSSLVHVWRDHSSRAKLKNTCPCYTRPNLRFAAGSSPKSLINYGNPLRDVLEQRVARLDDTTVLFIAAAGVGMGALGQLPEGGVDLRKIEQAFEWQP